MRLQRRNGPLSRATIPTSTSGAWGQPSRTKVPFCVDHGFIVESTTGEIQFTILVRALVIIQKQVAAGPCASGLIVRFRLILFSI